MAFKLLYFYILAHSAHSYCRAWVCPCFIPKTSNQIYKNLVCKSTPKFAANVNFVPVNYRSPVFTGYGLDVQGWRPSRGSKLYPCHNSQTGSKTHLASYPVGTGGSFCWGMRFTDHSSLVLTLILYEAVCPLPHTSSWHSVQLVTEKTPTLSTFLKRAHCIKKSWYMS